jgi:hypothetical protein
MGTRFIEEAPEEAQLLGQRQQRGPVAAVARSQAHRNMTAASAIAGRGSAA